MSQEHLLIIAVIILVTSVIQAAAGFGFALLAVPVMVLFIDLHQAVIIATLLGTVSNFGQAWQLRHHHDREIAKIFIIASCLGAPFGLALFRYGNQDVMKVLLGCAVLFGVWMLARGRDLQHAHKSLDWTMGWLSGVLLMATSTNGPPIVFTLQARRLMPEVQRATLNLIFSVTGISSVIIFAVAGKIHLDELRVALLTTPLMLLGVFIGTRARVYIDAVRFKRMVLVLLTLGGVSSLVSAFVG
ncbi:MAG: sulfite exporter TauE/SafE family protein [Actinobacteria bacterium]|nr:MAG: sulfite exporter TauE/SafE family protein [Actinomycetota bacterium]